jgi:hypothetical protein
MPQVGGAQCAQQTRACMARRTRPVSAASWERMVSQASRVTASRIHKLRFTAVPGTPDGSEMAPLVHSDAALKHAQSLCCVAWSACSDGTCYGLQPGVNVPYSLRVASENKSMTRCCRLGLRAGTCGKCRCCDRGRQLASAGRPLH